MISSRRLRQGEADKIIQLMNEQYGSAITGLFYINSENKVFLTTERAGDYKLNEFNAEGVGLYIGRLEKDGFRLSMEGAQLIKAKKNVLVIPDELVYDWVRGFPLNINSELRGYVVVMNGSDVLGCGKSLGESVLNYVPKARRILTYRKDASEPIDKRIK